MTKEERNNAIKVLKNFDLNNSKVNSLLFSAEEITNAFDMAIEALEQQEPIIDVSSVPHKIAEFFSNWDGDETAKMEISVKDMREISNIFVTKCRAESKLKALEQHNIDKLISKLEDEKFKLYDDDVHSGFDGGLERAKQIVKEFYEGKTNRERIL